MAVPRLMARINRRFFNPGQVGRGERPVLVHEGRTSGRTYETPSTPIRSPMGSPSSPSTGLRPTGCGTSSRQGGPRCGSTARRSLSPTHGCRRRTRRHPSLERVRRSHQRSSARRSCSAWTAAEVRWTQERRRSGSILAMHVDRTPLGALSDGREAHALDLGAGPYSARVLTYGGILASFVGPDDAGVPGDVVVGFDDLEGWRSDPQHFGALVGRYANRIRRGRLPLDGREVAVTANRPPDHLH